METKICKGPCGLEKPLTDFYDHREGNASYKAAFCKICANDRVTQQRKNPSPENKARWAKYSHNTNVRRWYGLEPEQYQLMLDEQNNVCAICQNPNHDGRRLHVDHDHLSGRIRGLLCSSCNNAIGLFKDNPQNLRVAAAYLEREYIVPAIPPKPITPWPERVTPKPNFCTVPNCGRPTAYRIYCQMHYFRLRRTGSVEPRRKITIPAAEIAALKQFNIQHASESMKNTMRKRYATWLTFDGETLTLREWANRLGITREALRNRLEIGWSLSDVLTRPRGKCGPKRTSKF